MAVFPGYTLDSLSKLTLWQFCALESVGAEILRQKAKAMQL